MVVALILFFCCLSNFSVGLLGFFLKVVENNEPIASESTIWDSKPLPAYQYFENVRNFLMAVKQLKLPAFEASDLERVILPNHNFLLIFLIDFVILNFT